jgi:hypothetical protein
VLDDGRSSRRHATRTRSASTSSPPAAPTTGPPSPPSASIEALPPGPVDLMARLASFMARGASRLGSSARRGPRRPMPARGRACGCPLRGRPPRAWIDPPPFTKQR